MRVELLVFVYGHGLTHAVYLDRMHLIRQFCKLRTAEVVAAIRIFKTRAHIDDGDMNSKKMVGTIKGLVLIEHLVFDGFS